MATMPPGNLTGGNLVTPGIPSLIGQTEIAQNLLPPPLGQRGRWISAEDYGWLTEEAGAAMNAALDAAAAAGISEVRYSSPHFNQRTPITFRIGVKIKGPGMNPQGLIRVAAGVQLTAQFETPDFETQIVTQPSNPSQGVIYDYGLEDVLLDGNCGSAQNTPVTTNGLRGMAFRVYGARPRFRNVGIIRTPGIGWYSKFVSIPSYIDFGNTLSTNSRDGSYFENIWVNDSQYESFVFQGPSDIDVRDLRGGWPANSLWSAAYSGKKSLLFPAGRLRWVVPTANGSGYTQAATSVSVTTDATTPPTVSPVVFNGAVVAYEVLTAGSNDATTCTITVNGDGTGATGAAYLSNYVVGGLIINKGAEFGGIVHCYNNAQGPAVEIRNDDAASSAPRFNAEFVMGESSVGGVVIADKAEGVIGRVDTHSNGIFGSPAFLPSLMVLSERGMQIGAWKERRDSATGNGALSLYIAGEDNKVSGKVKSVSGYAGDAAYVTGASNSVDLTVDNTSGFALVTSPNTIGANIRITSSRNAGAWKNYSTASNISSNIDIATYGSAPVSSAYVGLNNFSYLQWRNIRIIDRRSDSGLISGSSQSVSNSAQDLTLTTEQTVVIGHNIVRTPTASDISQVQVKPNVGATIVGVDYAYVSAISSTTVTVKYKLSGAGTGLGTVQVNIS